MIFFFYCRNSEWGDLETLFEGQPSIVNFQMEKRRHHQSLTTVDVESTMVLRRCQSPRYGRSFSRSAGSLNETSESTPTLLPSFGETSKELRPIRLDADDLETRVTGKRRESAPHLNGTDSDDSQPNIVICLTSADGLELNLTHPVQDNLQQAAKIVIRPAVRSVRVGATRPSPPNSSKLPTTLFSCLFSIVVPLLMFFILTYFCQRYLRLLLYYEALSEWDLVVLIDSWAVRSGGKKEEDLLWCFISLPILVWVNHVFIRVIFVFTSCAHETKEYGMNYGGRSFIHDSFLNRQSLPDRNEQDMASIRVH